jgi:hypothetical protein
MNRQPFHFLTALLQQGGSRRHLLSGLRSVSLGGLLGLLGLRAADANAPERDANSSSLIMKTMLPDNTLIIPGSDFELELSAKGAGADIRNWVSGQVGSAGAPVFINNHASGSPKTIINLHTGNVGIGTASPGAKLHVVGDLRVDGMLIGPMGFVSPHPGDPELELVSASPVGEEAGTYTRGTGELRAGEAVVNLSEHFALLSAPESLTVQLTARERPLHLFVAELTAERLVVREANGAGGTFDFLIQGARRGAGSNQTIRAKQPGFIAQSDTM